MREANPGENNLITKSAKSISCGSAEDVDKNNRHSARSRKDVKQTALRVGEILLDGALLVQVTLVELFPALLICPSRARRLYRLNFS